MFTKDAALKMGDGHFELLTNLTKVGSATLTVATKPDPNSTTDASFQMSVGEFLELLPESSTVPRVRCSPKAKLLLPGGGFVYAEECSGVMVETENGSERFVPCVAVKGEIVAPGSRWQTGELVSISLGTPHAACVNGVWFLVD